MMNQENNNIFNKNWMVILNLIFCHLHSTWKNVGFTEMRADLYHFLGTVPDKTARVPDAPLDLRWGYTKIYINGTYDTDQVFKQLFFYQTAAF